ncbi:MULTISPECIES: AraC family transcriptional regulator [Chryseobacterium]|uniref:AraC-like DNA-binding protein n=1 Tax=Chryseobacterium camelliae TaxID=1265445 RepID=A0ABU0TI13_9FLAO|nr:MULTISPECIES: AraC family transcriptional regulator [Chryseobacterium]MDT3406316.1 AraC-like DNA-binding protein [Pseudacidovorax intermedius]MDQ1095885.1 AraC-like DNA-binding protein [Chryseobacterium camelliae]MDQ1099822.1 AraC-like DNA-binding protein [Chryseobacterium sp. SORGH_AS_1048]MDR6087168.1 AraC-like DNA-binding protein [Chryseobacterium sp. SORGH_AS_0909]MDR6131541.1 AraC-like DNA-binding protein [Chryseobacterium sp. SORGH_AS_1175]
MKKRQFSTLVIHDLVADTFHLPNHSHTYYELVYVLKGKGRHYLNNLVTSYKPGDLFFISLEDEHYFEFASASRMVFIKFTDQYFETLRSFSQNNFHTTPEKIMRHRMLKELKLKFDNPSKAILRRIIENILDYSDQENISNSPIILHQIFSIFALVRETISKMDIRIDNGLPGKEEIITYIHHNIYKPEKTRINHLAAHFNISESYFSNYFKRNFEISLRDYISSYRLSLIEKRVETGQGTLKQIADEFGFNDESHLSHYYKRRRNQSIGQLKKIKSKG